MKGKCSVALVAVVATAIALTGCSTTATTGGTSTAGSLTTGELKGKTVAFIPGVTDPFYVSMQCGIQEAAAKYDMKVDVQIPQQFEAAVQTPIVNAETAKKPVGLLIAPTDAQALVPPLTKTIQAGIPVGLVDTTLDDQKLAFTSVATDNEDGGSKAADALAKLIGEKGKVLVIAFKAGASTSDARQAGFEKGIKKYSGIDYLGAQINDNDPAKAASIVSATLAANPDLKGIFATNLFAAQGAATGLRNAGAEGKVKIVGFDAGSAQVEQLQRGDVQALIAQNPTEIGKLAFDQLVDYLTGKKVTASITTKTTVITQDNLTSADSQAALYKEKC